MGSLKLKQVLIFKCMVIKGAKINTAYNKCLVMTPEGSKVYRKSHAIHTSDPSGVEQIKLVNCATPMGSLKIKQVLI